MTKSEYRAAVAAANKSRCAVCGKRVSLEDRCQDGLYLHIECARSVQTLPALKK